MKNDLKIFLIAGEASGDIIGANLIKSFKEQLPNVIFEGVGGYKMQAQGLKSLFPIQDLSLIGIFEIIPNLLKLNRRLNETYQAILNTNPDVLITIDSPGFNWRIVKKIRDKFGSKLKIINYVAPSVWAYKPERVHKVAALYDHQLLILPIEKNYFDKINFPSTFVGHPILEEHFPILDTKEEIRKKYQIPKDNKVITLMPGSRIGELTNHIPIFNEAITYLKREIPNLSIFIPTLPGLESLLKSGLSKHAPIITVDQTIKHELLSISDIALVKSGTSTIELMRYNLPMVVTYRLSTITALLLKLTVTTKYFALCNIILGKEIIPELIQEKCKADKISYTLKALIDHPDQQKYQRENFLVVLKQLGASSENKPSQIAVKTILQVLGNF
jgi:lipid-A-disaccharide synthase